MSLTSRNIQHRLRLAPTRHNQARRHSARRHRAPDGRTIRRAGRARDLGAGQRRAARLGRQRDDARHDPRGRRLGGRRRRRPAARRRRGRGRGRGIRRAREHRRAEVDVTALVGAVGLARRDERGRGDRGRAVAGVDDGRLERAVREGARLVAAAVLHGSRRCWAADCVGRLGEAQAGQAEEGGEGGKLHCGGGLTLLVAGRSVLSVSLCVLLAFARSGRWRPTVPGSPVVDGACLLGGWLF